EAPRAAKPPRARAASAAGGAGAGADLPAEAAGDFERLRAWRAATAKEQGVPAYVIFHDATLKAIAALRPSSLAQLGTVSGVGQSRLTKFGQQVLDTLQAGGEPAAAAAAAPPAPPSPRNLTAPPARLGAPSTPPSRTPGGRSAAPPEQRPGAAEPEL